ncbi:hypothetical protein V8E36_003541 [Tilletia maclaganii]
MSRREVADGLDAREGQWLLGVSFRMHRRNESSRMRVLTRSGGDVSPVCEISWDEASDNALPFGLHSMANNDLGFLRIGELDGSWSIKHDLGHIAPYFAYCPLEFRLANTQEWQPMRVISPHLVTPHQRAHFWRPAMAAMRALAARQDIEVPAEAQELSVPDAFDADRPLRRETNRKGQSTLHVSLARSDTINLKLTSFATKLGLPVDDLAALSAAELSAIQMHYVVEDGGTAATSTIYVQSRAGDEAWIPILGANANKPFFARVVAWYDKGQDEVCGFVGHRDGCHGDGCRLLGDRRDMGGGGRLPSRIRRKPPCHPVESQRALELGVSVAGLSHPPFSHDLRLQARSASHR